jgi:DNA polymerase I
MQNLPPEIRHYFVAPPGKKLLIADYSQLEYVAAAHISGDEALLEPLREGRDFHQVTAEMIGTERSRAKTVNFGVLYGMGPKALSKKLGTTENKA